MYFFRVLFLFPFLCFLLFLRPTNEDFPSTLCIQHVWKCVGGTIFALRDVAAFIAVLRVGGVAPGADAIPVWIPAVVQLQTVGSCGSPPDGNRWESFTVSDRLLQSAYSAVTNVIVSYLFIFYIGNVTCLSVDSHLWFEGVNIHKRKALSIYLLARWQQKNSIIS